MPSCEVRVGRVLVVEDEGLIRMAAVDFLEDAGFTTLECATADAAVKLLSAHSDISVLLTDVDMPGSMNGFELARLAGEQWPDMRIVVVSGMSRPCPGYMPEGADFIPKPYEMPAIVSAIEGAGGRGLDSASLNDHRSSR